jgi:spoIIIJ-associated protein
MKFSEKWGKDVDDAVRLALHDLKLERDQVEVIVLDMECVDMLIHD